MEERSVQRRLAAVLAADVAGYTRLMEQDTDGTVAAWQSARQDVIRPRVAEHSGKIVKLTGDGFLVEFPTVQDAVRCAIAMQEGLTSSHLKFRMGVNLGDIVDDGEDIHGEGVNIAARIEALADEGGINISGDVFNQIRNRIQARYEDRGEHEVKNVSAPVRVFAIQLGDRTGAVAGPPGQAIAEKPSIAVLPFDNLSGDPEQEYFSDGLSEDLITDLSKISDLDVVARNSSFSFKGQMPDVKTVGEKLDVGYVLEGSVRKMGDRLRINAQLIETKGGRHVWAERYDGEMAEIFEFQDRIRTEIVGALELKLKPSDLAVAKKQRTDNIEAYDLYLKGRDRYFRYNSDANADAIDCFERAIKLDPNFGDAYGYLSYCYFSDWANRWSDSQPTLEEALKLAETGVALDPNSAIAHTRLGWIQGWLRQYEKAFTSFETALSIDPGLDEAHSYYGELLSYFGEPEKGLALCKRAVELDPYAPPTWHFHIGNCYFELGRFSDAEKIYVAVLDQVPKFKPARVYLIYVYAEMGRFEEARNEYAFLDDGKTDLNWITGEVWPFRHDERRDRLMFLIREAGLPVEPNTKEKRDALPAFSDKPSIAVLPFDNLSGDPEQEYFSDGITEDIITALSRIRQFSVIARNTTFTYKGHAVDVHAIANDLGVRYVLEGSVRKSGDRVRITAQLIDGETGNHIWAEKFDRTLDDIFAVQDEITSIVTGTIEPELSRAEIERSKIKSPDNMDAWELFHRSMALINSRSKDGILKSRELLDRAIGLDSGFAPAYAAKSWSMSEDLFFGFQKHDPKENLDLARRAVELDDKDPFSHFALSWALTYAQQPEEAIAAMRRAIAINPSFAGAHAVLGRLLTQTGRPADGIAEVDLAVKLSPADPSRGQWFNVKGAANLYLGEYEEAIRWAKECIRVFDRWPPWMVILSAAGHLGYQDQIAEARDRLEMLRPSFSVEFSRENYIVYDQACLDRLLDGLRKAGVRED